MRHGPLANAAKHSQASEVSVTVTLRCERATTPLRDDAGKVRRSALRAERIARIARIAP
jgi:nitrate/nitrite-specific signal transduction histidine kinase